MSGLPPLLVIALMLVAGCLSSAPVDAPPPVVTTGILEVSSSPPGAEVYLDTVYRGTTPITITHEAGSHTLVLRLPGYQPWTKSIVIEAGGRGYVDTVLMPVPAVTSPPPTQPVTTPATLPATTSPVPTPTPTPRPRTFLGCFVFESSVRTSAGESVNITEIFWFQPAGIGLVNATFWYPPPKKPEFTRREFTWSQDPATGLITVDPVGGSGAPANVQYNADNDTMLFSNRNMPLTIFPRVPC